MLELAKKLNAIQDKFDMTDQEMANKIGCSRQWYNAIRRDQQTPGMKLWSLLRQAFPDELGKLASEAIAEMLK